MSNTVTLENSANTVVGTFATIQDAVNFAEANHQNGDTALVGPGTYQEQVLVDGSQISGITIEGSGQGQTTILSPDAANLQATLQNPDENHSNQDALIGVENGANVTVENLTVNGNNQGVVYATGNPPDGGDLVGIEALSSSLEVSNVHVTGTEDVESNGLQGGQGNSGIIADDRDGSAQTFTITGSTVDNFQKDGILMEGAGLTVNVNNNTVTGVGAGASQISQNLIEFDSGAAGSITDNTVNGINVGGPNDFQPGADAGLGILVFGAASGVTVSGNTVTAVSPNANSFGIFFAGVDGPIAENNTITDQGFALLDDGGSPQFLGFPDPFTTALTQNNNTFTDDGLNYFFYAGPTTTNVWSVTGTGGPDDLEGGANNDVFIVLGGKPNGNIFVGNAGIDEVQGYSTGFNLAIQSGQWVVTNGTLTDTLTGIEKVVIGGQTFDLVDQLGANTGGFQDIQDAVTAAQPGDIILANAGASPANVSVTVNNLTFEPSQTYVGITLTLGSGVHSVSLADFSAGQGTPVTVVANGLGDTITGNDAADQFTGGAGNDTFVVLNTGTTINQFGSRDVIDLPKLAFANGATASYNAATHVLTIVSGAVTDMLTVTNVAGTLFKVFNDGSGGTDVDLFVPPVPSDFSGDGMSDVFWRQSNGTLAEWLMNGSTITSSQIPTSLGNAVLPDSTWSVAGFGDFDGNGTSDILWRQSGTGALPIWSMNGSVITSNEITYQSQAVTPDSSWNVAGIGDFNGDGDADILWRQGSTSTLEDWSMNGATITSSQALTYQGQAITPDTSWSVAGIGDFNGDGKSDILWRQSSTGAVVDWSMNGATITSSQNLTSQGHAITPDASWSVAGVGDFNGDGDADLLWRQGSTGTLAMWLMNGSTISQSLIPTYQGNAISPDSSWNVVEVGDFNGDGKSDILWQQSSTGTVVDWTMNGAQIVSSQNITSQGNQVTPNSTWQVEQKPTNLA